MKIDDGLVISKSQILELIKTYEGFKTLTSSADSAEFMILNARIDELNNILKMSQSLEVIIRDSYFGSNVDEYIKEANI